MTANISAVLREGSLARHWQVLRDSWALESERRANRPLWRETDFLPAALELVETPPNPLRRIILWVLMAFITLALIWSFVARIDIVAVAPSKVIAAGRNKLVQSAEGGVVRAIYVQDGQMVRKGQPLVTLDPTASGADAAQAMANLQMAQVDAARSQALLAGLAGRAPQFVAPAGLPPTVATNQRLLVASRLDELRSRINALRQQAAEAEASGAGARAEVARLRDTLPFLVDRAQRRQSLVDKGYASKIVQLEIDQQLVDHQRQIAVQTQNARRAAAGVSGVAAQIAEARAQSTREVLADLSKAEADVRLAREEVTKAQQKSRLQLVRAPVDGVVQQLAVYSEGAVLKPADPILVVVPNYAELVVEAQVLNRDIGFVKVGQPVTVKLEAFPFTRYGTLEGRLVRISRDAIQDERLGPVYQARVAINAGKPSGMRESGIALAPGLQATAEIRTSDRRVIDYLLSPIERRLDEAARER